MMENEQTQEFQTFVYAYALGCLDREDFIRLMEYTESSGSFPWQELGEYQNLAALLPSFLNIEQPAPGVKDKVARRLYRLKDAKKASMPARPEPPKPAAPSLELPKAPQMQVPPQVPTPPAQEEEIAVPKDFKRVTSFSQRGGESTRPQQDTQVKARSSAPPQDEPLRAPAPEPAPEPAPFSLSGFDEPEPQQQFAEEEFIINQDGFGQPEPPPQPAGPAPVQTPVTGDLESIRRQVLQNYQDANTTAIEGPPVQTGISPKYFYTVILILVAAIIGVYYLLSKQIITNEKSAKEQVKTEIETAKMHNSKVIQASDLLESPNCQVITFLPQSRREAGFARFIVDTEKKTGFLILSGLEMTKAEEGYQLWMETPEPQRFGIGRPNEFGTGGGKTELFQIGSLQDLPLQGDVTFFITLEKGKDTPGFPSKRKHLEVKYTFPK